MMEDKKTGERPESGLSPGKKYTKGLEVNPVGIRLQGLSLIYKFAIDQALGGRLRRSATTS